MKFVCERCHTKYSIADEKVRGKVLKVRCKTCANVVTVRETGATIDDAAVAGPRDAPVSRSGSFEAEHAPTVIAPPAARMRPAAPLPTAALFAPGAPAAAPPPRARRLTPPPPPADNIDWYLAVDGAQTGPFTRGRLIDKVLATPKDADIHVWNAELDGWKPPKDIPEIESDLARRRRLPTPAPPPPLRRPSAALPIAAAPEGHASGAVSHGGLAALDVGSQPVKLPAAFPKTNGVATPTATAVGGAQHAHGRFGLGDLLDERDVGPTPPPANAKAHIATALRGAEPVVDQQAMLTPPPAAGVPAPSVFAPSAGMASAAIAASAGRAKQVKLLLGALGVVVVVCVIVLVSMFRKPAPTNVGAATAPTTQPTDFAGMAEKLAKEEPEKPKDTAGAGPAIVEAGPVVARVDASNPKGAKGKPKRKGMSTAPPPLGGSATQGLTAEQRDAANRFGDSTGRDIRLPTAGTPSSRSTPAQADISRVISNNRQGIQTCYQRALLRDNTLTHGKVTVRVSIGLSGKVKSVNLDAPAQFRALEPCIRDVMSRWAFPPSSEEYGTEFPVVLQGNQ